MINVPLKISTFHLQDNQTRSSTALNLNPYLKAEAAIKNHRFQKSKNHLADVLPPPTPGNSCITISSSDVRISEKLNMNLTNLPPTAVFFPTKTPNQDKPSSISTITTLQVGQSINHVESNGTRFPAIITKVMICTIYGDPMYLIEGTPNQNHQANIDYLRKPSDNDMFFIKKSFGLSIPTRTQNNGSR